MKGKELSLATLHELSEGFSEDFGQQLQAIMADCKERPSIAAKRTIQLKLSVVPHPENPNEVLVEAVASCKVPARKMEPIRAIRSKRNQLLFGFPQEEKEKPEKPEKPEGRKRAGIGGTRGRQETDAAP